ncbi:crotonase/enoyl-CoA hydratase family protein [Pseudonocardia sp. Cha107L01]|uniref:crotonase/enoyl-CoA hydratase family protein n=1 Tax=Pseudonocardia sp. Cha107L01 TaxID=3457576 RepID=UPI00403EEC44
MSAEANTHDTSTSTGTGAGSEVLTEVRGAVLLITLNRPRSHNAINAALGLGLETALRRLDSDPALRVGVLTGAGDRTFCAGADLKALAAGESLSPGGDRERGVGALFRHQVSKPLLAAVNGAALGGGTEIALACDLVVAADTAVFGLPEVTRGLPAAGGGALRLAREIPVKLAMELLLLGDRIDAQTAARVGLVNRVVAASEVLAQTLALAERIAGNAPLAVQANKRLAYEGLVYGEVHDPRLWAWHDDIVRSVVGSRDAREGPRAFAEKRPPQWTGS